MNNWESVKISTIVQRTSTENPINNPDNEFCYIDISSVNRDTNKIENPKILLGKNAPSRARKSVQKGDILFATTRPNLKNIALLDDTIDNAIASTGFCVLRVKQNLVLEDYLFYYLLTEIVQEAISPFIRGAQYPAISDSDLFSVNIPLPSITIQKKIVSQLESLFNKIDLSISLLEENLNYSKALMGSILDEAFTNLEHTSKVVKISKIANIRGGKRLPKGEQLQDTKTDYPYIRVTDFNDNGSIDINGLKYMTKEIQSKISRYIITSDDLYISIAGTIGKTGIIPKELDGANLTENAARFVYKDKKSISNKFVYYYTKSDKFKAFVAEATKQVAQPKLALSRLNEIELALPSITEQEKAVEKFIEMENTLLKMEKEIQIKLDNMKALKSSLLDQAFKGEF